MPRRLANDIENWAPLNLLYQMLELRLEPKDNNMGVPNMFFIKWTFTNNSLQIRLGIGWMYQGVPLQNVATQHIRKHFLWITLAKRMVHFNYGSNSV